MKSKTVRFGCYWLRAYICCGELRIDGGLNAFEEVPERQTTCMLASSKKQLKQLVLFVDSMKIMIMELLLEK